MIFQMVAFSKAYHFGNSMLVLRGVHPSDFVSLKVGPQELGLPNCVEAISQALDK